MSGVLELLPEAYIVVPVTCVVATAIWLVLAPQSVEAERAPTLEVCFTH